MAAEDMYEPHLRTIIATKAIMVFENFIQYVTIELHNNVQKLFLVSPTTLDQLLPLL